MKKYFIYVYMTSKIENIVNVNEWNTFAVKHMQPKINDNCTENYQTLVINNVKSTELQDQVFWYKAEPHNDFKLGSKEFWELSKDMHSDDEEEKYDPGNSNKKGAGPKISVKKTKW